MVVTEPRCVGPDPSQTETMFTDDDDSSDSSFAQQRDDRGRKRTTPSGEDDEQETKRQKNREAARRCRDKKQQQTEELRKKNSELEKENCELAKQRDDMIRRCREFQYEIDEHREQGCSVPHFEPPFDLDAILSAQTPPSPSSLCVSRSSSPAPSLSPAPSVSPGPPLPPSAPLQRPVRRATRRLLPGGQPQEMNGWAQVQAGGGPPRNMVNGSSGEAMVPPATMTPTLAPSGPAEPQVHYLKVKKKDGSVTNLRLSTEDYLKVKQRMGALKAAKEKKMQLEMQEIEREEDLEHTQQQQQLQQLQQMHELQQRHQLEEHQLQQQMLQAQARAKAQAQQSLAQAQAHAQARKMAQAQALTAGNQPTEQMPFMPQMPHDPPADVSEGFGRGAEEPAPKLDTFNDLLGVLASNVKVGADGTYSYELVPVNPNDVLPDGDLGVKMEPADSGYELKTPMMQQGGVIEVKQEEEGCSQQQQQQQRTPIGAWSSTAETIRAGMDTLTEQDIPGQPNDAQNVQNIINFLSAPEPAGSSFTVTVTDPKTSRVLETATSTSFPMSLATTTTTINNTTTNNNNNSQAMAGGVPRNTSYIVSSSPVASLAVKSGPRAGLTPQAAGVGAEAGHPLSAIHNVKLRPAAAQRAAACTPGILPVTVPQWQTQIRPAAGSAVQNRQLQQAMDAERLIAEAGTSFTAVSSRHPPRGMAAAADPRTTVAASPRSGNNVIVTKIADTLNSSDLRSLQLMGPASSELVSTSTSQVLDYLNNHSIEVMNQ